MILSFVYSDPICGEPDNRPWIVAKVHYMYFAMFSFFSTGLVMCLVSLISHPPTEDQIRGLTFWTRNEGLTPNKQLTFDDDDNGFGTTNDSVMRQVRFGAEISLKDPEEEEEEMDSKTNELPSKKFVVEELGKSNQQYECYVLGVTHKDSEYSVGTHFDKITSEYNCGEK